MKSVQTASQLIVLFALPAALLPAAGGNNNKTKVAAVRSFVPPLAIPVAETALIEDPGFDASLFAKELPLLFSAAAPAGARNIEGEIRLRKAEGHYKKGRELAAKGELVSARAEFDAAIEQLAGASPIMPERARLMARYQTLLDEIYTLESRPSAGKSITAPPANEGDEPAAAPAQEPPPGFDRAPVELVAESTFSIEPDLRGKVLDQVRSTVSQLRLEVEDPVIGFINFYTTPGGREIVKSGLKRAGRYAPMIRRILDEEGLPPEMLYLAQVESGFMPRAVSWASAAGMWQFVAARGREYKLTQTPYT
ncbi:MAG: lytic transglycosylase domain-containing protein, partial [Acidobacteria bacterium]|nr:lytic transglycosylase domain-containing protein [Acidobacteriota bacterium]